MQKIQKLDDDLKIVLSWVKNRVRSEWQEISKYGAIVQEYFNKVTKK